MAHKTSQDRETFACSICKDPQTSPVTLPCRHSYCMACIKSHWDTGRDDDDYADDEMIYSCPRCEQTFMFRPDMKNSARFAVLVEELKKTGVQAAPAGAEDVACDVCTGRKRKAAKSCLVCLASYCQKHVQPHYKSAPFKRHKLMDPSKKLQENICSRHNEIMKMFCRTDQQSICYLCSMEQHKGHEMVSSAAEVLQRVEKTRQEVLLRVQAREEDVKVLELELDTIKRCADKAVEDSEKLFGELIHLLEKRLSDVKQQIRSRQDSEVSKGRELEEKLQQEIAELKKKDGELKQLSHAEDHNLFLLNWPLVSALGPSTHVSITNISPQGFFEKMTAGVVELGAQLQDRLTEAWRNISPTVTQNTSPEPQTRAEFLELSQELKMDANTSHKYLSLSEGNRRITSLAKLRPRSKINPDRLSDCIQVLSGQSLNARSYWEVEWTTGRGVCVAVTYKNISREECTFGLNDKSWALYCNQKSIDFFHDHVWTQVLPGPSPTFSRVGVFLDQGAGTLSFYGISADTMTLLHRVQATFTQPPYAGLGICGLRSMAEFCKLK